ncbi:DNA methyltransferase [Pseudanabaena sp. FACHB-2040]|uniref:DNA methyltransferase n=1 Tax=Pseudanabaena sp. FACHB-2040 TaxID=2692859 RepID=UPI0016869ED2|nr:DNA methyltransferase [Pseudanabaena sp. FACHB-2040]MBD2257257.1 hypothetical protein [Pseudanabaena sp. FACHB-2040]
MNTLTQQVQSRLERFEFTALFREVLGWAAVGVSPALLATESKDGVLSGLSWRAIAQRSHYTVVEVSLNRPWDLDPDLRQQVYWAIAAEVSHLLLIFLEASGQRSLWMWPGSAEPAEYLHSQIYIRGQVDKGWASRLARLHPQISEDPEQLHSHLLTALSDGSEQFGDVQAHFQAFQASLEQIYSGITGIGRICDRKHYALVVLCRLLALAQQQRQGWLDQGDEWYLHNRFGQSQQRGANQFFSEFLQPLWFQGFILPSQERPLLVQELGEVPFLPTGPFQPHPLEQQYDQIQIADVAFEAALTWLGDLAESAAPDQILDLLGPLFERFVNQPGDLPLITPEPMLRALCDRTLERCLLQQSQPFAAIPPPSLDDLLMAMAAPNARVLLEQMPSLTILDPACGSGRYLARALQFLTQTGAALAAILKTTSGISLPDWLKLEPESSLTLALQRRLLNRSFLGVELSAQALELARLQIFLQLVQQVKQVQELQGLPDLALTVLQGNSLIGLIKVDSERFDQVEDKAAAEQPETEADLALQGNLLQPLLAENYRSTLAERQIWLEHYRDQTHLLSEVNGIPGYVQAEFLRDRLLELNRTVQDELNQLLLSEFSQQLGIRYRQSDSQGRQQRRLLTLADIEALQPFHWGFHVHQLLEQGGFDIVLCHPPWSGVQSTAEGFFTAFQDLFERKGIPLEAFRHHRKELLSIDAALATAWRDYCGQFTLLSDYFRRAEPFRNAAQPPPNHSQMRLSQARLLLERSQQLLRPGGIGAFLLPPDLWHHDNAVRLRHWLREENQVLSVIEVSNQQGALGDLPARTAVSLLWLEKGSPTPENAALYEQPAPSPTAAALWSLLQSPIHLLEESVEVG